MGFSPKLATVGAQGQNNQVVQFQLRDAEASSEDLQSHLSRYVESRSGASPFGALRFSGLARGGGRPSSCKEHVGVAICLGPFIWPGAISG